jgi:hypothetical protein
MGHRLLLQKAHTVKNNSGEDHLHCNVSVGDMVRHHREILRKEVSGLSIQRLKNTPTDKIISSLSDQLSINIPVLDISNPVPATREFDINRSGHHDYEFVGGPRMVKGTEITITVPYTGDTEAFRMHASSHTMDYPMGRVDEKTITFSKRGQQLDGQQVRREFDAWIGTINTHLDGMRKELGDFNTKIEKEVTDAINVRLEKIKQDESLLDGLGFGTTKNP